MISGLTISGGSTASDGGGLANYGTATLTNVTVSRNSAGDAAGLSNRGTAILTDCTVTGNSAAVFGGGLTNFGGTLTLTNDTVSGNTAVSSGGVNLLGGTATLTACTISGNTGILASPDYVGGMYVQPGGTTKLVNTIVAGNTDPARRQRHRRVRYGLRPEQPDRPRRLGRAFQRRQSPS